jgi:type I restriction enzyme S subunit
MRKGWEYKKLGDCFSYIKNGANIKQKKDADGFPITRIETLSGGVFNRDRMGYAGIHDLSKYADYVLESKDLLMSHINSKTYIGRTVEYKGNNEEAIIHGMNLLRLKAIHELIDSTFFAYYTQSGDFKSKIARIRKDAVNQSSFAISDLKRFDIPLPPKSTQLAIVSELDKINELIRLKKEQLKDFDNLAQSLFYEMFGDPVENEKGWEEKKLGDVYKMKSGDSLSTKNFIEGDIPVYGGNGISGYHNQYNKDGSYIIIGRVGVYCGNARIVKGQFWLTDNAFELFYDKSIQNEVFVCKLLNLLNLRQYANAAAQPVISNNTLKHIPIPLPPLSLQRLFAQRIEQIEREKSEVQKSIQDLETLLASRMQYWFE